MSRLLACFAMQRKSLTGVIVAAALVEAAVALDVVPSRFVPPPTGVVASTVETLQDPAAIRMGIEMGKMGSEMGGRDA